MFTYLQWLFNYEFQYFMTVVLNTFSAPMVSFSLCFRQGIKSHSPASRAQRMTASIWNLLIHFILRKHILSYYLLGYSWVVSIYEQLWLNMQVYITQTANFFRLRFRYLCYWIVFIRSIFIIRIFAMDEDVQLVQWVMYLLPYPPFT